MAVRGRPRMLEEAGKCAYCGFCEAVCPTLPHGRHRGYGPRGRVLLSAHLASGGKASQEVLSSIYTCLTCAACTLKCPAGIDIPGLIRQARAILAANGGMRRQNYSHLGNS